MKITNSPWGVPQTVEEVGDGVYLVMTASHGGYYVPPAVNKRIPASWRAVSFNAQGVRGWYEEDCDWCMVALALPHLFIREEVEIARRIFRQWQEPKLYQGAAEGY
jgi:hypothetical protein